MNKSDLTAEPLQQLAEGTGPATRLATTLSLMLLVLGGFNWALVGLVGIDFIAELFGVMSVPTRLVYAAIGVAAVYALSLLARPGRI